MERKLSFFEQVQQCQNEILRFRAAHEARSQEEMTVAHEALMEILDPILIGIARRLTGIGVSHEEALKDLIDMFRTDLFSAGYKSLAIKFGAYLNTLPVRLQRKYPEKYIAQRASISIEAESVFSQENDPYIQGDEELVDKESSDLWEIVDGRIDLEAALSKLPPLERQVLKYRLRDWKNNDIAATLGIPVSTATQIYNRSIQILRTIFEVPNE